MSSVQGELSTSESENQDDNGNGNDDNGDNVNDDGEDNVALRCTETEQLTLSPLLYSHKS